MKNITLATSNLGKIKEFSLFFDSKEFVLHTAENFSCLEDGSSFIENALKKVKSVKTNDYILADDSGLVVPLLDNEPGLYSARYSCDGRHLDKLISRLKNNGLERAPAYFYCALVFSRGNDDPCPIVVTASWDGEIRTKISGENGFGYDPIFYIAGNKSAAELSSKEKLLISHRGKALTKLIELL